MHRAKVGQRNSSVARYDDMRVALLILKITERNYSLTDLVSQAVNTL